MLDLPTAHVICSWGSELLEMLVLVLKGAPHMAVVLVGEAGHGLLLLLVDHGGLIEGLLGQPRLADGGDAEIGEHRERWGWGGSRRSRGADGRAGRGHAAVYTE